MRKASLAPAHMHAGPNMTPLVDIVMVILIFLMLAGSFGSSEIFLKSTLPVTIGVIDDTQETPIPTTHPKIDIHVYTAAGGIDVMQMSGEEVISNSEVLAAKLKERHALFTAAGTADDVQVIIRPAGDIAWAPVIATYDAALQAQFKKVNFAQAR